MAVVSDALELLRVLELSQILEPDVMAELSQAQDLPGTPGELAERLIQQGLITRFQAKQLLAGRHRGFVLGPYRVLDQIGQGGMGTVFLGEHINFKRKVAIKVLSREQAESTEAVERFQREARASAALCHPNIMRVHHAGFENGAYFMVMEYIDGMTLEELVDRKGPLPVEEAVRVAAQAAAGLQHAHEKGFVHRDVKPENLMLTRTGVLKILDMGLTKSVNRAEDNLTGLLNSGAILGTLDYLSPEQALQATIDPRADLYSLGATLFTLLTGLSPYEGVPAKQKLMQHQFGAVPDVQTFCPEVPKKLSLVVQKMMAKKPEDRYASALEVIEALTPWLGRDNTVDIALTLTSGSIKTPSREQSKTPTVSEASSDTARIDLEIPARTKEGSITRADVYVMPEIFQKRRWVGIVAGLLIVSAIAAGMWLFR